MIIIGVQRNVADLQVTRMSRVSTRILRECYGETAVMDFRLNAVVSWTIAACNFCAINSQLFYNTFEYLHLLQRVACNNCTQEGLAVASIARDDPSTLPGDDPFPRTRMHRDRNAR